MGNRLLGNRLFLLHGSAPIAPASVSTVSSTAAVASSTVASSSSSVVSSSIVSSAPASLKGINKKKNTFRFNARKNTSRTPRPLSLDPTNKKDLAEAQDFYPRYLDAAGELNPVKYRFSPFDEEEEHLIRKNSNGYELRKLFKNSTIL